MTLAACLLTAAPLCASSRDIGEQAPSKAGFLAGDDAAPAPADAATAAAPADPCSSAAIDAKDPAIPEEGWDPSLPPREKAVLATHYAARAQEYQKCKMWQGALANYGIALQLDPQNLTILALRAGMYMDMDDPHYAEAASDYTAAIALNDPRHPYVYIRSLYAGRAYAYIKLQRYPEAISDLNMVIDQLASLSPAGMKPIPEQRERRARAYLSIGDDDHAKAELTSLIAAGTSVTWEDYYDLALVLARSGDVAGAITNLGFAAQRLPESLTGEDARPARAEIELALARALVRRGGPGDMVLAREAYKKSLADDHDNVQALAEMTALPAPLDPPVFQEPTPEPLVLPPGIVDLDHDRPAPFCTLEDKFAYLNQVNSLTNLVNRNVSMMDRFIDSLNELWQKYNADPLATDAGKRANLDAIGAENDKWQKIVADWTAKGFALGRFFQRVKDDDGLVRPCANPSGQ
jgi:tetratricopeptide (TPR) repeat protein